MYTPFDQMLYYKRLYKYLVMYENIPTKDCFYKKMKVNWLKK